MAIGGKVRENQEFSKKIGVFVGKVIVINPDREQYKELLGIELKEDSGATNYVGESKEGNTTVRIAFWVEDKNGFKQPVTFFLENKLKENKDATKKQYINATGTTSWASDENNLLGWFKNHEYRPAYVGEDELYEFVRNWLGKLDYRDASTTIMAEWKKLMKGNVKEFQDLIGSDITTPVGNMAIVKIVNKEGEDSKEYQGIWNRGFLPEYAVKQLKLQDYSKPEVIAALKEKEAKAKKASDLKPHERFVLKAIGEYGIRDVYSFKELHDYDPSQHFVSSTEVISETGSDY